MTNTLFQDQAKLLQDVQLISVTGRVVKVAGLVVTAEGLPLPLGAACTIKPERKPPVPAQVVGFDRGNTMLMPLKELFGTAAGDPVSSAPSVEHIPVGDHLLGRVLDGLARPIDGKGRIPVNTHYPVINNAPHALDRTKIDQQLVTGIRSIDATLSVGTGQRIGLFAGTGVGKSVTLGMIARNTDADVNVIALVGERGREVGDFLRKDLGHEGQQRSVLVVSTSDESPVMRVRACFTATTIAEYFRDRGNNVLLMMDSITRVAMAQRQIGLAIGEPPTTKGYPPSVFSLLPQLLERAGKTSDGSITGLYTVLVEADDINEPVADAVRGILDGHIWLSRELAGAGHYPAISVLDSISRVMIDVVDDEHLAAARDIRRVLAVWDDIKDLVNIGAYAKGTTVEYDLAVEMKPQIDTFLKQAIQEKSSADETRTQLLNLRDRILKSESTLQDQSHQPTTLTAPTK
jgi:flagellum-specific ATP synthase